MSGGMIGLVSGPAEAASIKGGLPRNICKCYEGGYGFGRYNYRPSNSGQAETLRFKCNMKGWEQAFRDGWQNGYKDYRFSQGDTRYGMGTSLCPY